MINLALDRLGEEHLLRGLMATCFHNCTAENSAAIEREIGTHIEWVLEPAKEAVNK
jgi:hypothetical protein